MEPLHNKVALITGASRGIGAATAILLAKAGADIVVKYHSSEKDAASVVAEVEAQGRRGLAVRADVRDKNDIKKLVSEAINTFGKVDIVVNNANINFAFKPFMEMNWEEFSSKLN